MKEDILEQVVEDYLHLLGYFTLHNLKFKPAKGKGHVPQQDSVNSDIDILGIHPGLTGPERVFAVSCKSWQGGFNPKTWLKRIKEKKSVSGREAWRGFRELTMDKWAKAFTKIIREKTNAQEFTYCTAVTKLIGARETWETNTAFIKRLDGNPIKVLTMKEMLNFIWENLTTTPASSELGRLLQLIKASGWRVPESPGKRATKSPGG